MSTAILNVNTTTGHSSQLTKRFEVSRILGKGAFATVYIARDRQPTGQQRRKRQLFALKLVNVNEVLSRRRQRRQGEHHENSTNKVDVDDETNRLFFSSRILQSDDCVEETDNGCQSVLDLIKREIAVHSSASSYKHPNVVSIIESFQYTCEIKRSLMVAILTEYCSQGDLHTYLKRRREDRRLFFNETPREECLQQLGSFQSTLLDEEEARHALRHILRGLSFLHSRGIVHRDIKAGNIFLVSSHHNSPGLEETSALDVEYENLSNDIDCTLLDCTLKIGDFGLAVQMSENDDWDEAQHTLCGTPSCLAPEVALSTPKSQAVQKLQITNSHLPDDTFFSDGNDISDSILAGHGISIGQEGEPSRGHGQPADLWSAGCLLYAMLIGRYPFSLTRPENFSKQAETSPCKAARVHDTISRVLKGEWTVPENVKLSNEANSLLCQLLSLDPQKRGFARGILSTHSFFGSGTKKPDDSFKLAHRIADSKSVPSLMDNQSHIIKAGTVIDKGREIQPIDCKPRPPRSNVVPSKRNVNFSIESSRLEKCSTESIRSSTAPHLSAPKATAAGCGIEANDSQRTAEFFPRSFHSLCHDESIPSEVHPSSSVGNLNCPLKNSLANIPNMPLHIGATVSHMYGDSNVLRASKHQKGKNELANTSCEHEIHDTNPLDCSLQNENSDIACQRMLQNPASELVNPIEAVHRLPLMKHQWKESKRKGKEAHSKSKRFFEVFILPKSAGLVISCEEKGKKGVWLHVTADGLRVCVGKLLSAPNPVCVSFASASSDAEKQLFAEAFRRAPQKSQVGDFRDGDMSPYISPVTAHMSFSSTVLSMSAHSLPPLYSTAATKSMSYKPLSSLLAQKNKLFLSLYRKLETIVDRIKQRTPKITLYVHASKVPATGVSSLLVRTEQNFAPVEYPQSLGFLICKSMLMENDPFPHIETRFVDGVTVLHQLSRGLVKIFTPSDDGALKLVVEFAIEEVSGTTSKCPSYALELSSKVNLKAAKTHLHHVKLACSAVNYCLLTKTLAEKHFATTLQNSYRKGRISPISVSSLQRCPAVTIQSEIFPITKRVIANSKHHADWISVCESYGPNNSMSQTAVASIETSSPFSFFHGQTATNKGTETQYDCFMNEH